MADVKMPETIPCQFDIGWGKCGTPTNNGWCSDHENLKCVSCGEKAIKKCDHGMGGLICGVSLCGTCSHGKFGEHITKEIAEKMLQEEQEEQDTLIASRTNPTQHMDDKFGVPATLFELLKGDWENSGYKLMKLYFLELKHGLMGFFPAIFSSERERIVFTVDLYLMERVWQTLDPESATIGVVTAYVNLELSIGYTEPQYPNEREKTKPVKVLNIAEFESLVGTDKPFKWASGLFGGGTSQDNFLKQLSEQAFVLDSTFTSMVTGH